MATIPVNTDKGLYPLTPAINVDDKQQQGWHPQFLEKAQCLHQELLNLNHKLDTAFLEMGMVLKEIRDRQLYKPLDYKSFNAYLKDLDFSRSRAYTLIGVVEDFYLTGQINETQLVNIGWEKLSILRTIKENQSFGRWVEKAIALSKRQLRQSLLKAGLITSKKPSTNAPSLDQQIDANPEVSIIPPEQNEKEPIYYLAVKKIQAVKVLSEEELEQAKASGVYPLIVGVVGSAYAKLTSLGLPSLIKSNDHLPTITASTNHKTSTGE